MVKERLLDGEVIVFGNKNKKHINCFYNFTNQEFVIEIPHSNDFFKYKSWGYYEEKLNEELNKIVWIKRM